MARQEMIPFRDDLDGSQKDVQTVKFEFEGASYEIDLGPKNQAKLREALNPGLSVGAAV